MRASMSAVGLVTALSACITVQPSAGGPYTTTVPEPGPGYGQVTEQPLQARLIPEYGASSISFALSRPAYVAIFEMLPGRGARLIYPSSFGEDQLMAAGYQRAMIFPATAHSLSSAYAGLDPYGLSSPWGNPGGLVLETPRYLYLVASEYPLSVSQFINSPLALRSVLGFSSFEISNPYVAFDRLNSAVLQPGTPDGSWTTDLYVDWQSRQGYSPYYPPRNRGYVAVRCADGRVIYVPVGSTVNLCSAEPAPPQGTVDSTKHPRGSPADSLRHRTGPIGPGSDGGVRRQPPPPSATDEGRASRGRDLRVKEDEPGRPNGPPERTGPVEPRSSRPEAGPPRPEPPRATPGHATPARPTPARAEPRPEPRAEPARSEPPRSEPPRAEPAPPARSLPQGQGQPPAR